MSKDKNVKVEQMDDEQVVPVIRYKKLHPDARLFERQTKFASGMDMYALYDEQIPPKTVLLIPTGIAIELPEWLEGQVRCRSGMAKKGIIVANGVGTIDPDYRGDVSVLLYNTTDKYYLVKKGDRIAQFTVAPIITPEFEETEDFTETERGEGGFGSTDGKETSTANQSYPEPTDSLQS